MESAEAAWALYLGSGSEYAGVLYPGLPDFLNP